MAEKPKQMRRTLTIRVRDATRAKVRAMADRNGRSMSEELEMLVEQRVTLAQQLGMRDRDGVR